MDRAFILAVSPLIFALFAGCGVGFEVSDGGKKRAEVDDIHLTPPPAPLKVGRQEAGASLNGLAGKDITGITSVFDFVSAKDQTVIIDIKTLSHEGCPGDDAPDVKFTWRELGQDGATIAEAAVLPTDKYSLHQATYALIVELTTGHGRCKAMALNFAVMSVAR